MTNIQANTRFVKAETFVKTFTPYRNKHIRVSDAPSLFGSAWVTRDSYMTDTMIESSIEGRLLLGYFLATTPKAFALDIDDHTGRGPGALASIYRDVVARFDGQFPSVLRKSPRGLHAHYFLAYPIPQNVLIARLADMLEGLPVEIRPTATTALRMPSEADLIDPETFLPLRHDFQTIVSEAERYHPAVLMGENIVPAEIRQGLRERRAGVARLRRSSTIARAENERTYIYPKETNDALCDLIPLYRSAGLPPEEAAARFGSLLAPVYDGELRNWDRLLKRVTGFYNGKERTPYEGGRADFGLFDLAAAAAVGASWNPPELNKQMKGAATKRRKNLESFTLEVLQWRGYIDSVKKCASETATWDYLYPYFRKNTREGYYPLPRNLLMKIDTHYHRLLPHLMETGFLERSPYQYSAEGGICFYYRINDQQFI